MWQTKYSSFTQTTSVSWWGPKNALKQHNDNLLITIMWVKIPRRLCSWFNLTEKMFSQITVFFPFAIYIDQCEMPSFGDAAEMSAFCLMQWSAWSIKYIKYKCLFTEILTWFRTNVQTMLLAASYTSSYVSKQVTATLTSILSTWCRN